MCSIATSSPCTPRYPLYVLSRIIITRGSYRRQPLRIFLRRKAKQAQWNRRLPCACLTTPDSSRQVPRLIICKVLSKSLSDGFEKNSRLMKTRVWQQPLPCLESSVKWLPGCNKQNDYSLPMAPSCQGRKYSRELLQCGLPLLGDLNDRIIVPLTEAFCGFVEQTLSINVSSNAFWMFTE